MPFCCPQQSLLQSEPRGARTPVWALPLSLAATRGIDVSFGNVFSFLSSGYLDVSVHRVPFRTLFDSDTDTWSLSMWVPPFRYPRISGYLLLPAAFRSLSRLSSALSAKASSLRSFLLDLEVNYFVINFWRTFGSPFEVNYFATNLCISLRG